MLENDFIFPLFY